MGHVSILPDRASRPSQCPASPAPKLGCPALGHRLSPRVPGSTAASEVSVRSRQRPRRLPPPVAFGLQRLVRESGCPPERKPTARLSPPRRRAGTPAPTPGTYRPPTRWTCNDSTGGSLGLPRLPQLPNGGPQSAPSARAGEAWRERQSAIRRGHRSPTGAAFASADCLSEGGLMPRDGPDEQGKIYNLASSRAPARSAAEEPLRCARSVVFRAARGFAIRSKEASR